MADNMFEEDDVQWFSAKLRILEAEYEKSKLQVFQDTLLCKRSMIELELLCKNEQLRKNTRVNNRIKESEFELQEQLKYLSVDLENATNQLQTVQNTLQDEKTQHNLEKKELEEKLGLEMEKRMEEQKKNAGHRERLLQEEIKNLQDEQVKTLRETEDLRMELRRKNVSVKAKAIQTQVTVKHASTMAQVDSQTSDVGVQAQSAASEVPPMNCENNQGTDGVVHENSESGKGGKKVVGLTGRNKDKRKAKDNDQDKGLKNRNEKAKKKKKQPDKGKENGGIVGEKTKNERKPCSTRREITTPPSKVTAEAGEQERLCDRTTMGDAFLSFSASQEDGVSLQYDKTPRLRKKSDESEQSLENNRQKSDVNNVLSGNTPALNTESAAAKKQSEVISEGMREVCLENGNNHASKGKDGEEGRETGFDEEAERYGKKNSARRTSIIHVHQQNVEEQQSHVQMEDKEEGTCDPKMGGTGEEEQDKESKRTVKEKKRTMKEKSEYIRKIKTKEVEAAEEEISHDKNPEKEKCEKRIEDDNNDSANQRVLRSRAKKRNSGAKINPCKGQGDDVNNKSLAKNSRQIPLGIDGISAAKKCETDDTWSKGHEPAMLLTSSPEDHQFPRKTELSSNEIDTLVDETHPSPGATTRASDDTYQQPETEIQESERVRDYNSCQGSVVVDDNQIKEVGEKINTENLHSATERVESKKGSCEEKDTETSSREEKVEPKIELFSKKCRKSKRTLKKGGDGYDAGTSRRQDSSAFFADNDTCLTRPKNKSTTSHKGHSRGRKEQKRTGQPAIALKKTDATLKENAPSEKSAGKKRKPNQSVREVSAPADLQSSADGTTSTDSSSVLDNTKKRKTLFNARENSLMVSASKVQISFTNTALSKGRTNTGIPPSLSAFMRSFIAPKLKKSF